MAEVTEQAAAAQVTAQAATIAQVNAQPNAEKQAEGGKLSDSEAALLKENMAMKRKLQAIESQQADSDKKVLLEQGKYKELAELNERKSAGLAERLIRAELAANLPGLLKPDLLKLCDTSTLQVLPDGSVEGVAAIAEAFRTANPEYFSTVDVKPVVPGTPRPGVISGATGYLTYDDYEKAPRAEALKWAAQNPDSFRKLADTAINQKR